MMEKSVGSRRVFSLCLLFSLCLHGGFLFFLQNFYSFRTTPHFHDKSFAAREQMTLPARREDSPILHIALHLPSRRGAEDKGSLVANTPSLQKEKEDFGKVHIPSFLGKKGQEEFVPLRFLQKHREPKKASLPVDTGFLVKKPSSAAPLLVERAKEIEKKLALAKELLVEKTIVKREEEETPSLPNEGSLKLEQSPSATKTEEALSLVPQRQAEPSAPDAPPSYKTDLTPFHYKGSYSALQKHSFADSGKKGALFKRKPPLSFRMPSSSDLHILSCSNDFDVDVVYNLREDGEGYLFALSLIPKKNLSLQKIKQNYLFLLDRSHSIGEERFFSSRAALFSALSVLDKEDTFNIIVFDKKSEMLFEKNMQISPSTIRHAKEFLQKQKVAGFFTTTNISRPLFLGSQQLMQEAGNKTIVYISNGETLDKGNHKKAIYDWTQKNKGAICFYSLIQKGDKKRGVMEYLSAVNKGKLFVAQTQSGFKRQLKKLINSVRFPIAQNMEAFVYLKREGTDVALYPSLREIPNLYLDQPFVLLGTTKKLEPFTIFLQGRSKGQWFHIKKEIFFQESQASSRLLYEEWALHKAFRLYDAYLRDGKEEYLLEARDILTPYGLEEAFR